MKKSFLFFILLTSFSLFANSPETQKIINQTGRINTDKASKLFFTGNFLYWIPQEIGLAYATTNAARGQVNSRNFITPQDGIKRVKPSGEIGFRLTLGYKLDYDKFDTLITWTSLKAKASNQITGRDDILSSETSLDNFFIPLWGGSITKAKIPKDLPLVRYAKGSWKLDTNILDWEFARSNLITKNLALRPFLGLRGAVIDQKLEITYDAFDNTTNPASLDQTIIKLTPKSDFKGLGIRGGIDTTYNFIKGFGIYAIGSLSFLYSKFDCNLKSTFDPVGSDPLGELVNTKDKFYSPVAATQLAAGLKWDFKLSSEKVNLRLQALWECNNWYGVNKMQHYLYTYNKVNFYKENADLTLQGLTLTARMDF